jgi:hypothetical protein
VSGRERAGWVALLLLVAAASRGRGPDAVEPVLSPATAASCPPGGTASRAHWAPAAPSVDFGSRPLVWDVLTHPDQFVGQEVELTGYAIVGFEVVLLAQSVHEVRNFEEWATIRPRQSPHMHLLALKLPRSEDGRGWSHLRDRKVRVRGRLMPAVDPGEPEPGLRWAYGMMFEVDHIEEQ